MTPRAFGLAAALLSLSACHQPSSLIEQLPEVTSNVEAAQRLNGGVGTTDTPAAPLVSYGQPLSLSLPADARATARGDITLDFADTDIREVAAQILGTMLRVNYVIDPGVRGTATLHTSVPLSSAQLLPVLQTLLAQNGASLVQSDGLYRVAASSAQGAAPQAGVPPGAAGADPTGNVVVPLRFAGADDLARVLGPFVGPGARITADPARGAVLISGDPAVRATLLSLIQAFDIDLLAGQSYALLPVSSGDAKDFASSLQDAFRSQNGGALANVLRVIPMARMNAVLVVAAQPRYIDDARRVYGIIERSRRMTVRAWHVYYLQNSHANDAAYVLQRAFTPGDVSAPPPSASQTAPGAATQQFSGGAAGRSGAGLGAGATSTPGGLGSSLASGGNASSAGGLAGPSAASLGGVGPATAPSQATPGPSANPLLGGLDPSALGSAADTNTMRIIPNPQNNAILVYATQQEEDTMEAMLRKVDILPLQVRIDATIAEVTLNDQLKYGTQFFFKSGGINGVLSAGTQTNTVATIAQTVLGANLPGFLIGGNGLNGAPFAINALQAVTTVHVLSSPELLVLDNQTARLQVGNLVPYLTTSSQSTLVNNAPIINSVQYQPTGVIMQVTPRVNSGGLVTLDIAQEVSDVDYSSPRASGIDSPTFLERNVSSRIVVQDGQTIGLAGLIRDSQTRGNSGLPWLKDIPLLGLLAGTQDNQRARTELLILITPHVLHDQRDARALTEDLRDQLINAAVVPTELRRQPPSGSSDPGRPLRRSLRLER